MPATSSSSLRTRRCDSTPRAADPAEAPPGSTYHLWEHFARWRPAELQAAAEGLDGRVMHDADLSAAAGQVPYGEERAALRAAMETLQRLVMHDDGWELVHAGMRAHRHDLRPLNAPRASTMATKGERSS